MLWTPSIQILQMFSTSGQFKADGKRGIHVTETIAVGNLAIGANRNSLGDNRLKRCLPPMLLKPGSQFLKMLLMMVIRGHENESERISFQPRVAIPIQKVLF
jgi:hypothetical protein